MQASEFLYHQNQFVIAGVVFGLMLVAAEHGFRRGRRAGGAVGDATRSEITTLQAALMGLLALLLAFTFEMSVTRFGARLEMVVDEANAVGTMSLRADTLAEPTRSDVLAATRAYVLARIRIFDDRTPPAEKIKAENEAMRLQQQMWAVTAAAARQSDRSVVLGLFESSLNAVFDMGAKRDAVMHNHVPQSVLVLLFIASISAMGATGYASGLGDSRNSWAVVTMSGVVALVILVIMDMDRPGRGFIQVSQQRMITLVASLSPPSAAPHVQPSAGLVEGSNR